MLKLKENYKDDEWNIDWVNKQFKVPEVIGLIKEVKINWIPRINFNFFY